MQDNLIYLQIFIFTISNLFFFIQRKKIYYYLNTVDKPDGKIKLHKKIVYPVGGLIFFFNVVPFFLLEIFFRKEIHEFYGDTLYDNLVFIFAITSLVLVGLFDDKYNLNYYTKLILLTVIIFICVSINENLIITELRFSFTKDVIYLGEMSKFLTILSFLLFINALNLFDGIDLQSGTYILIIISVFLLFLKLEIFFILLISCLIFLYLNFKKEIFLGDNGTILLGFIISYFCIYFYNDNLFLGDEVFILLMVPGIDMIRLFILRISKGKHPFKGDRNHMHHLLIKKYGYLKTIIIINLIILVLIFGNLILKISSVVILPLYLLSYYFLIRKKKA